MADQLALFGVVVGIALLLSGIGFIVLAAYGMVRIAAAGREAGSVAGRCHDAGHGLVADSEARVGDGPRLGQAGPISTMRRSSA